MRQSFVSRGIRRAPSSDRRNEPPKSSKRVREAHFGLLHVSRSRSREAGVGVGVESTLSDHHGEGDPQRRPRCLHIARYRITSPEAVLIARGFSVPLLKNKEQTNSRAKRKVAPPSRGPPRGVPRAATVYYHTPTAERPRLSEFCLVYS